MTETKPTTTTSRIVDLLCAQLDLAPEAVKPESRIVEDLGADSLDIVEIVMAAEDLFGIEIDDEEAEQIVTVQDATALVDARLATQDR